MKENIQQFSAVLPITHKQSYLFSTSDVEALTSVDEDKPYIYLSIECFRTNKEITRVEKQSL